MFKFSKLIQPIYVVIPFLIRFCSSMASAAAAAWKNHIARQETTSIITKLNLLFNHPSTYINTFKWYFEWCLRCTKLIHCVTGANPTHTPDPPCFYACYLPMSALYTGICFYLYSIDWLFGGFWGCPDF